MQRGLVVTGLLFALSAGAAAQTPRTIDPGMTRAQVIERLGQPAAVRATGSSTYLFYKNGCVRACGMDDVVILEGDGVVDAIFRSSERQYTGQSSSPRAISASEASRARRGVIQAGSPASVDTTSAAPTPIPDSRPVASPAQAPADPVPPPVPVARPNLAPTRSADAVTGTLRINVKSGKAQPDSASGKRGADAPPPASDTTHHGGSQKPEG